MTFILETVASLKDLTKYTNIYSLIHCRVPHQAEEFTGKQKQNKEKEGKIDLVLRTKPFLLVHPNLKSSVSASHMRFLRLPSSAPKDLLVHPLDSVVFAVDQATELQSVSSQGCGGHYLSGYGFFLNCNCTQESRENGISSCRTT